MDAQSLLMPVLACWPAGAGSGEHLPRTSATEPPRGDLQAPRCAPPRATLREWHATAAELLVVLQPALKAHSSTEQGCPLRRITFFAPVYEKYSQIGEHFLVVPLGCAVVARRQANFASFSAKSSIRICRFIHPNVECSPQSRNLRDHV